MADQRDSFPFEQRIRHLVGPYAEAQRTLVAQIRAAAASGDLGRRQRRLQALQSVLDTLDRLGVQTDPTARELVADAVQEAAQRTAQLIGPHVGPVDATSFAGVSDEAIATLADSVVASLQGARANVGRQIADEFARAGRRSTLQAILGAQGSRRETSAELVARLRDKGIAGFVDRAGKRWALDTYAEMAIRTTTRQAVVEGAKARMAAQGIRLARVSTHADVCDVCRPWQGRLVSLDGTVASYRGDAVVDLGAMPNGGPPFHPRCRHTLLPVAEQLDAFLGGLGG